jgi:cytidine deaminase
MEPAIGIMISKAHQMLAHSYSPYSKFKVACCICTDKNNLYTGVNVENKSYSLTVCAETSALSAMIAAGEYSIKSVVILAGTNEICSPCGACRQRIYEFSKPDTVIHLCTKESLECSMTIHELLPKAFDFKKPK